MLACIIVYHVVINIPVSVKSWIKSVKQIRKPQHSNNDLTIPFLDDNGGTPSTTSSLQNVTYSVIDVAALEYT